MLKKLLDWLYWHRLVWCVRCRKLMFLTDAKREWTTTGIVATLCDDCHRDLFHPFGGEG